MDARFLVGRRHRRRRTDAEWPLLGALSSTVLWAVRRDWPDGTHEFIRPRDDQVAAFGQWMADHRYWRRGPMRPRLSPMTPTGPPTSSTPSTCIRPRCGCSTSGPRRSPTCCWPPPRVGMTWSKRCGGSPSAHHAADRPGTCDAGRTVHRCHPAVDAVQACRSCQVLIVNDALHGWIHPARPAHGMCRYTPGRAATTPGAAGRRTVDSPAAAPRRVTYPLSGEERREDLCSVAAQSAW